MVSKYPTRPPRWHESVIKSYPVSDLRRLIEAADKDEEEANGEEKEKEHA